MCSMRLAHTDISIVIITENDMVAAAVVRSHIMKPVGDGSWSPLMYIQNAISRCDS